VLNTALNRVEVRLISGNGEGLQLRISSALEEVRDELSAQGAGSVLFEALVGPTTCDEGGAHLFERDNRPRMATFYCTFGHA
jgi:hypothetical protein